MLYNYWAVMAFLFGAVIGSFLNVVIWRLPRGQSLLYPGSHCPSCNRPLTALENIPLVSFLALRARCRGCGTRISSRYFWVELITAGLFLTIYLKFGPTPQTVFYCLFLAPLIAAFCTDVDAFLIPDQLHLFALGIGISYDIYGIITGQADHRLVWGWLPTSVRGAMICAGIFLLIQIVGLAVFRKDAMGDGDVKLARAIGAMLPLPNALVSFFLAIAVGAIWGVASLAVRATQLESEAEDSGMGAAEETDDDGGGILAILQWSAIYLFFIDALLFIARALRIRKLVPLANDVAPVEFLEDDDFVPGATHLPFGPFMVVGVLLAIFFGESLLKWYLRWSGLG